MLLHVLLAWVLLQAAGLGVTGEGHAQQGESDGDGLVVQFIALPSVARIASPAPQLAQNDVANPSRHSSTTSDSSARKTDVARPLSKTGEYTSARHASPSSAAATAHPTSASSAQGGSPASDLLANYQAALRARIGETWRNLTDRRFPTGCDLRLTQSPGGAVTATSAHGCALSREDRLQLEAAALMAQPLPYAGFEAVFAAEIQLPL